MQAVLDGLLDGGCSQATSATKGAAHLVELGATALTAMYFMSIR
jgi:hypothetical protein